jgi:two-component system, OmpR family, phosphate regulon sensor histidine kinase PhoR
MIPKRLSLQLFLILLIMVLVPLAIVIGYSASVFRQFSMTKTIEDVKARAFLVNRELVYLLPSLATASIDSLCKSLGRAIDTRITVVDRTGTVLGDTDKDPATMESHANRPEILDAFAGHEATTERFSTTLHESMLYIALPLYQADTIFGAVRLAKSVASLDQFIDLFYKRLIGAGILLVLIAGLASFLVARSITRPITEMQVGARRFASGDLGGQISLPAQDELRKLAESLNTMAGQLSERFETITRQRNKQEAILASMTEGVLAIDNNKRIISINRAAAIILGENQGQVQGKWIHEVVRNTDLQKFLSLIESDSSKSAEMTIALPSPSGEQHLQVHGSLLRDTQEKTIGALIVLTDITRLKQLENIRKDFVANVSHELRTPLTAIKGFVETLLTDAAQMPAESRHFLEIISSKVDRICSIVDDLLSLSSIERDSEQEEIGFEAIRLRQVVMAALDDVATQARTRKITLDAECAESIRVRANSSLLEQAIVNLLDNAIKYSDDGKTVRVQVRTEANEAIIEVQDQGIGIAAEHHNRLFERFYRVDKARSRKLGGTGLGLSIVKNIAASHGGRVSMESTLGTGSTFRIHLPLNSEKA